MQVVAMGWLVLDLSQDPFTLGLLGAASYGPLLVFGLFGGLVADRLPKRRTLILAQAAEMILAIALFTLTISGRIEVWQILMLALGFGLVEAIGTPTRHAFVIEIVGREDVANAIALNVSMFNVARVVGPAVAGVLITTTGIASVFLVNALSYLAVIVALVGMRPEELHSPPPIRRSHGTRGALADLAEGIRFVAGEPFLRLVVVALGIVSVFGINFEVLGPPLARNVLGTDAAGFGFLMSGYGAGALAAALAIAFVGTRPMIVAIGAAILGVSELALAGSGSLSVSVILMALAGLGAIAMGTTGNLTLQLGAPDQLRGRVVSLYTVVFDGTAPIGGLIMGAIASGAGVAAALAIGGAFSLVAGLGVAFTLQRLPRAAQA
jgi:predicted MFS family arabinose efflux permease